MPKSKFTIEELFDKRMEEVRGLHRLPQPISPGGSILERLRQAAQRQKGITPSLPKLPRV